MATRSPIITDQAAEKITKVEELAYELRIHEVMTKNVLCLSPDLSMKEAVEIFQRDRISGAPVTEGDTLIGILSMEDLMRALQENGLTSPVRDYMTSNVISVREYDPVVEALKTFNKKKYGRLPY